jgi:hypothetical protein
MIDFELRDSKTKGGYRGCGTRNIEGLERVAKTQKRNKSVSDRYRVQKGSERGGLLMGVSER